MTSLERYRAKLTGSDAEENLWGQLRMLGLADRLFSESAVRQYAWPQAEVAASRPAPLTPTGKVRRWTADFCFVGRRLLIEVDGAVWVKGGHTSGRGYTEDRERDAEALCCGYYTLRVTPAQIESGQVIRWIERLLK